MHARHCKCMYAGHEDCAWSTHTVSCTDLSTSAHSQNDTRVQIEGKRNELFDDTPAGNAAADHAVAELRRAPGLCVGISAALTSTEDSGSDSDNDDDGHFRKRSNTGGGGGDGSGGDGSDSSSSND